MSYRKGRRTAGSRVLNLCAQCRSGEDTVMKTRGKGVGQVSQNNNLKMLDIYI